MRTAMALLLAASTSISAQAPVTAEFIFESAPFPSVHASTIAETREGLVTAWFGGTREGASDVGIWVSRRMNGTWTTPVEVATASSRWHAASHLEPCSFRAAQRRAHALL
jgi:alpha-L-rhamnosidase